MDLIRLSGFEPNVDIPIVLAYNRNNVRCTDKSSNRMCVEEVSVSK